MKITKFCNVLVPKMSLLAEVVIFAATDLIFFSISLMIGIAAFADCFYVLLGANLAEFYSIRMSFISLFRALFGDFDVDGIGACAGVDHARCSRSKRAAALRNLERRTRGTSDVCDSHVICRTCRDEQRRRTRQHSARLWRAQHLTLD